MTYKQIKNVRRTPKELAAFRQAKDAFMRQGYPEEIAETYSWDILFAGRRGRSNFKVSR